MYTIKKLLYTIFVNNRVIRFINAPAVSLAVPCLVGLYYGTLDIWGDHWSWIKDHRPLHGFIFSVLASATVLVLFFKGISDTARGITTRKYDELLDSIIGFFNDLVRNKKVRFHNTAQKLKSSGDIFEIIAQPKDQLEFLLARARRFLEDGFDLDPRNIGITIIQGKPGANQWWYELKCDPQRQHHKAQDIMNSTSTAKFCLDSGDSLFISDIRKGLRSRVFTESARSKKSGIGSIFCKPIRVKVGAIEYVYIFTIAIFGEYLCTPYDEDECRACEKILDEVADRVELELCLLSIKKYRKARGGTP